MSPCLQGSPSLQDLSHFSQSDSLVRKPRVPEGHLIARCPELEAQPPQQDPSTNCGSIITLPFILEAIWEASSRARSSFSSQDPVPVPQALKSQRPHRRNWGGVGVESFKNAQAGQLRGTPGLPASVPGTQPQRGGQ